MRIGRKIFYDKVTGVKILDTGQWDDVIREKTVDEEISTFTTLSERNRATFDVLELPYGAFAQDFAECSGYRVNPATRTLEFSYAPPSDPPVFQRPLTEQVADLKAENIETMLALTEVYEMLLGEGGGV